MPAARARAGARDRVVFVGGGDTTRFAPAEVAASDRLGAGWPAGACLLIAAWTASIRGRSVKIRPREAATARPEPSPHAKVPATLQCASGPTCAQPAAGDVSAHEGRKLDGEVRWHVDGPSRAVDSLPAIVTLRTAALPASVDTARMLGDGGCVTRHVVGACRRPSQSHCGAEAGDGPRWAIDMQFHISISDVVPRHRSRVEVVAARGRAGAVRRRTGASRAPWRATAVPGARWPPPEVESSSNARGVRPSRPDSADMRRRTAPARPCASDNLRQPTDPSSTKADYPQRANQ